MKINKNSLQARINNLSKDKGVPANTILQNYFFDAFLKRLSKSNYKDNFVFKGGFLLSTSLDLNYRATLDIDFLLRNISLSKDNIQKMFKEIIKIKVDDNIVFEFSNIEEIRQEDEYGGYSVSLLGRLENIKVPVNIDIATGDPITPHVITYNYKCLLDNETLLFSAYNLETIIAEKLQTVLRRGLTNSRSKDFYDLYILYKLRWNEIDIANLKEAYKNTCNYRQTIFSKDEALSIVEDIKEDKRMLDRWEAYKKKNTFAIDIQFSSCVTIIFTIIEAAY